MQVYEKLYVFFPPPLENIVSYNSGLLLELDVKNSSLGYHLHNPLCCSWSLGPALMGPHVERKMHGHVPAPYAGTSLEDAALKRTL